MVPSVEGPQAWHGANAAGQMQRATRYMALRDEANALDDEAATWLLLWHLAGDKDPRFPAAWGAPGGGAGLVALQEAGRTTVHQQAAAVIAQDEHINRSAALMQAGHLLRASAA